jgi:hypothetical protein
MLSRGVIYSVDAQDLLEGLGALSPDEEARLNRFHRAMYERIRTKNNDELIYFQSSASPDQAYANGSANATATMLAITRLLDDREGFFVTLYGGEGQAAVDLPLVAYRFPKNDSITAEESDAKIKSSSGPFTLDAILFGKWRD